MALSVQVQPGGIYQCNVSSTCPVINLYIMQKNVFPTGLGSSTVLVLGTCTYLSVLDDVLEYLVYENVKVLVLGQKVLGTY